MSSDSIVEFSSDGWITYVIYTNMRCVSTQDCNVMNIRVKKWDLLGVKGEYDGKDAIDFNWLLLNIPLDLT